MEVKAPFGFVTSCYSKDVFMVQATLASIKYYCPDVPICLIVDGNVDVAELEREYDLIVLRVADLPSAEMRQLIEGSTRSKLAAMWEGPFEFYVWMDSDAILWGDITPQLRTDVDFQIFWDEISIPADAEQEPPWLSHYYFDLEKLKKFDPDFEWRGHPYFCDGVFACKRGAISFSRWAEVFQWRKHENDPWTKGFNCMPMMNYLVHSLGSRGEINVVWTDLQWVKVVSTQDWFVTVQIPTGAFRRKLIEHGYYIFVGASPTHGIVIVTAARLPSPDLSIISVVEENSRLG